MSAKIARIALAAALLLAVAVSAASAGRLSFSSQDIRATWNNFEFEDGTTTIRCQASLEGRLHTRTIAKVARSLIGGLTRAILLRETCTRGIIAAFNGVAMYNGRVTEDTLPWHITYESFAGTLPSISSVNFLLSRFRFGIENGGGCTAQYGTATDNVTLTAAREAGGGITTITPVEGSNTITLLRRDAGIFCSNTARLKNTGQFMVLETTSTKITVTLI